MSLWTPANITTALWLDAADTETIILEDSKVAQWNDKSGNARNSTQPNTILRPSLIVGAQNGRDVVRFFDHYLFNPLEVTTTEAFTICCAVRFDSFTASPFPIVFNFRTTNGNSGFMLFGSASIWEYGDFSFGSNALWSRFKASHVAPSNSKTFFSVTSNGVNPQQNFNFTFRQNGTHTSVAGAGNYLVVPNTTTIGGTDSFSGVTLDIYEIFVVPSIIDLPTAQIIEGYFAHKWGLVDLLPYDHPYLVAPEGSLSSLTGTVYEKNSVGVLVPGAYPVRLYRREDGVLVGSTISAADGTYQINDIPAVDGSGNYIEYYAVAIDVSSPLQRAALHEGIILI